MNLKLFKVGFKVDQGGAEVCGDLEVMNLENYTTIQLNSCIVGRVY